MIKSGQKTEATYPVMTMDQAKIYEQVSRNLDDVLMAAKVPANAQNIRITRDNRGQISISFSATLRLSGRC